jgi:predicted ATPase
MPELGTERLDLPNPEAVTEPWQRQRLFEALARAVLQDNEPRLLLLDDLQWCDQDTLEWLHYLLHFHPEAKLLILGGVRPEEVGKAHPLTSLLLNLRLREQVTEIELGPLDTRDTAALAEQVAGRTLDTDHIARLYRYTEGNPLFVIETIRTGLNGDEARRSLLPVTADHAGKSSTFTKLPPKIQAVIQDRLARLSPPARKLVCLAAIVGCAFDYDVLAQASDSDEESLVQALDELWRRRIIRELGQDAFDFSHNLIREVAYAEISPARRRLLHRRVAAALEQSYATDLDTVNGQIAVHFEKAGKEAQVKSQERTIF